MAIFRDFSTTIIFFVLTSLGFLSLRGLLVQHKSAMGLGFPVGSKQPWEVAAEEKRQRDLDKIPFEWRLAITQVEEARKRKSIVGDYVERVLDSETRRITAMDGIALLEGMANGSLTAVQVVSSFSKRTAYAHQLGGYLLEIGFDVALAQARELDAYYGKNQKLIGPLHGLPVTMKDQFHVKGMQTTASYIGWVDTFEGQKGTGKEKHFESELVKELKSLGAVIIAKTTLPHGTWAPETNNNIAKYTWNPHNQRLSTGGSSGGEGAIQAMRGSAFGVGTDSGGSVSMPAAMTGGYAFKPSTGRISYKDVATSAPGQMVLPTVAGLIGSSLPTLQLVFKSLLSLEPWLYDPFVLPIPWRSHEEFAPTSDTKPSLGFMLTDGLVTPHPPVTRALRIVEAALKANSMDLIDWVPPSNNLSMEIHGPINRGDGCPDVWQNLNLSGEPVVPEVSAIFGPDGKPKPPMDLVEYEDVVVKMKEYRAKYLDYWRSSASRTRTGRPVDAVISAVTPYAAVRPGGFLHSPYTSSLNVLDFTTIVIPITFADEKKDTIDPQFDPLTEKDRINMETYDAKLTDGAPASIMVFSQRLGEEKLFSIANIVDEAVRKYKEEHGEA